MAIKRALLILIVMAASSSVYAADERVNLLVGRSTVIDTGSPIQRISLTSSDVADALVTSSAQLLVHGKMPGTISMFVWDRAGAIRRYDVTVQRDLSRLTAQIQELFPAEHITVQSTGRSVAVSGTVSTKLVADKAVELVGGFMDKKEDVVNLLQVQEAGASDQVLLQVRFAEVTRNAITQLGSSFFTGAGGYKNIMARTTTGQDAAPVFDNGDPAHPKLVFSDFLNLFLFDAKNQLGTVITALQTRGQFQSLAEPNLVAESGKEASFLAGGEFPVPIAQGSSGGGNVAISVQYKEFGVRLSFTPIIRGDRIHLKVKPEVSSLDFANGVSLQGFRIPALTVRRAETELELGDGQTFAIAGLLNNQMNSTLRKIPGIGDIPILGLLFQSKVAQKEQTELVVMITPHILPRNSPGVTATLPRTPDTFLAPMPIKKTVAPPPPAFSTPRPGGDDDTRVIPPVAPAAEARPSVPSAAAAAAAVSALSPKGATVVQEAPKGQPVQEATAAKKASASKDAHAVQPADLKALEKAEQRATQGQAKRDTSTAKQAAKQAEIQRRQDVQDAKRLEQLSREQAKRDAEAAGKAAQVAARQAEVDKQAAARQAQVDKRVAARQADADKKQQKVIDEASARLKAAAANYESEIAKKDKTASDN